MAHMIAPVSIGSVHLTLMFTKLSMDAAEQRGGGDECDGGGGAPNKKSMLTLNESDEATMLQKIQKYLAVTLTLIIPKLEGGAVGGGGVFGWGGGEEEVGRTPLPKKKCKVGGGGGGVANEK